MEQRVSITLQDGVADVRMTRPDKLNALDPAMVVALRTAAKDLSDDPSVRAVVLSGEGRGFCAGLDFTGFMRMAGAPTGTGQPQVNMLERSAETPANVIQDACWIWHRMPVPVLAAVHGVAYGGGLQLALGADIRYVHPDASLSVMEIKWGLVPDMSGTQTLRHLVRQDVAKELTFTGRKVDGREAVALGLCTRVSDDPHAEAMAAARAIADKSPDAIRAGKLLWNSVLEGSYEAGLVREERLQLSLIGRSNNREAIQANLEKRAPRFSDSTWREPLGDAPQPREPERSPGDAPNPSRADEPR